MRVGLQCAGIKTLLCLLACLQVFVDKITWYSIDTSWFNWLQCFWLLQVSGSSPVCMLLFRAVSGFPGNWLPALCYSWRSCHDCLKECKYNSEMAVCFSMQLTQLGEGRYAGLNRQKSTFQSYIIPTVKSRTVRDTRGGGAYSRLLGLQHPPRGLQS